jgi:Zn-dependent protease
MLLLTLNEVFDMIVMTLAVGFIFSGIFRRPAEEEYDPLKESSSRFNWKDLQFAILVSVPGIIIHEFGHKLVAMSFGLSATFHAQYLWLAIGVGLKLANFPFIFFVPAAVTIYGGASPLVHSLIAFAGPGVNLILWLGTLFLMKAKLVKKKYYPIIYLTSRINMFLFIFNMIPFPPFDGYTVFSGIIQTFF